MRKVIPILSRNAPPARRGSERLLQLCDSLLGERLGLLRLQRPARRRLRRRLLSLRLVLVETGIHVTVELPECLAIEGVNVDFNLPVGVAERRHVGADDLDHLDQVVRPKLVDTGRQLGLLFESHVTRVIDGWFGKHHSTRRPSRIGVRSGSFSLAWTSTPSSAPPSGRLHHGRGDQRCARHAKELLLTLHRHVLLLLLQQRLHLFKLLLHLPLNGLMLLLQRLGCLLLANDCFVWYRIHLLIEDPGENTRRLDEIRVRRVEDGTILPHTSDVLLDLLYVPV
mmetsp:Transcript_13672/g.43800  ORF Transcript_13672/g.43800 Transcript_13672/m.43800 type:complete len:282 (+) Transcript_13672:1072-1917(+)